MFSLQDTPVQIDGISFAEMGPGAAFSQLNGEQTDFSQVMAELQQLEGNISLEQLAENPAMLEDLGLSSDHLKMLQHLLADGKSLPEAAEAVLFDIKQQLAELPGQLSSADQVENIEALQEELTALLDLLPEDVRSAVETELQVLRQLVEPLKEKLETAAKLEISEDHKSTAQAALTTENPDGHSVDVAQQDVDTTQDEAQASESASSVAAMLNHGQQNSQATGRKPEQGGNTQATPAVQNNAASQLNNGNATGFRGNENGHIDIDAEYELLSEGKPVAENKVMPNLINQQANSRMAQLQLNDQAMSSQAMEKFSGQGTGNNLQSGSNNASYTQLMTQTTPSPVTQNIHKPEWGNAIGQRVTWMIGKKLQGAQLRISPAHLGPIDIKLSIESGVAQVSFHSNHQVVRDALEQAVPRLREMLETQDLELDEVNISDRNQAGSHGMHSEVTHSQSHDAASGDKEADLASGTEDQVETDVLQSDALLDAYA